MSASPEWMGRPWRDTEWSGNLGICLPRDAPAAAVLAEMLNNDGLTLAQLTDEEVAQLTAALRFDPLFSVVTADRDELGDDVEWHTDASGKRTRPTWWLDDTAYCVVLHAVEARSAVGEGWR